jgi:hypothetical protein
MAELTGDPRAGAARVAELEPTSPADRRAALDLAEDLVDRYISPAAELFTATSTDPSRLRLDIDALAGADVPGLSLARLERLLPALEPRPGDGQLQAALADVGVEIPSADRRAAFLRGWTAERAAPLVAKLLEVVMDPAEDPAVDEWERRRLEGLRGSALPAYVHALVEAALQRRRRR